jgi:ribosome-associated protein
MNVKEILLDWILSNGDYQFSRSSGPGGQNVNRRETRVQLRLGFADFPFPEKLSLVLEQLSRFLTKEGELLLESSEERRQDRNRDRVNTKALGADLLGALRPRKKRKKSRSFPSRPPAPPGGQKAPEPEKEPSASQRNFD